MKLETRKTKPTNPTNRSEEATAKKGVSGGHQRLVKQLQQRELPGTGEMGGRQEDYGQGLYYKHRPLQLSVGAMRVEGCSGVDGLDIEDLGFAGTVVADPFEAVLAAVDGGPLYHG